jgi:hypothetical protein
MASRRCFPLNPFEPTALRVSSSVWDVIGDRARRPPGHFNRLLEPKVAARGGFKSLYFTARFTRDGLRTCCEGPADERPKARYDPRNRSAD